MSKSKDQFSKKETEQRMKAALLGARVAGPKHKSVTQKSARPKRLAKRKR